MELQVFEIPLVLEGASIVSHEVISAGNIPNVKECVDTIVYYAEVLETDKVVHDVLIEAEDFKAVSAQLGEYSEKDLTIMAVVLPTLKMLIRFYKTSEWPCTEHPEMFMYQPLGMYHCGHCSEMVVAGLFHPSFDTEQV